METMTDVWGTDCSVKVMKQLVALEKRLLAIQFPASGSLYFAHDLPSESPNVSLGHLPQSEGEVEVGAVRESFPPSALWVAEEKGFPAEGKKQERRFLTLCAGWRSCFCSGLHCVGRGFCFQGVLRTEGRESERERYPNHDIRRPRQLLKLLPR